MSNKEFNYMSKCLVGAMENLENVRTIKEVYYIKGIVRALEDILYKFCTDTQINKVNHMLVNIKNDY